MWVWNRESAGRTSAVGISGSDQDGSDATRSAGTARRRHVGPRVPPRADRLPRHRVRSATGRGGTVIAEQPTPHDATESALSRLRSGVEARAATAAESVRERHEQLLARTTWAETVTRIGRRHLAENGSMMAGYLAYRLFLLLLPMAVIIIAVAGFDGVGAEAAAGHLRLGQVLADTIATAGNDAQRSRAPLLLTGLVAFAVAAWGLLGALQYISAAAWQIPTRRFPGKGRAFVRLAGSMLLFGVVLYVSMVVRRAGLVAGLAGSAANTLGVFVGFMGLSWILPRRCREWFWLLPGAVVGTLGFIGVQAFAAFYLPGKLANASATYGALGITLAVLTYLFMVGFMLWAMFLVNSVVWEHRRDDPPGLLRRIADRVPLPTTTFGSGYVGEGDAADTVGGLLQSVRGAGRGAGD